MNEKEEVLFTLKDDYAFKRLLGVEENHGNIARFPRMCIRPKE